MKPNGNSFIKDLVVFSTYTEINYIIALKIIFIEIIFRSIHTFLNQNVTKKEERDILFRKLNRL